MLVIRDTLYGKRVPVLIGTTVPEQAMKLIMQEDLNKANETWKSTNLSTVITEK